jgi:hypothetical protein
MARTMCLSRRVERLFVQIPICIAVVLGLSIVLTRFILVLKESLLESPADWKSLLFLAFLVGSASLIIMVACAGVGAVVGFLLGNAAHRGTVRRALARGRQSENGGMPGKRTQDS